MVQHSTQLKRWTEISEQLTPSMNRSDVKTNRPKDFQAVTQQTSVIVPAFKVYKVYLRSEWVCSSDWNHKKILVHSPANMLSRSQIMICASLLRLIKCTSLFSGEMIEIWNQSASAPVLKTVGTVKCKNLKWLLWWPLMTSDKSVASLDNIVSVRDPDEDKIIVPIHLKSWDKT